MSRVGGFWEGATAEAFAYHTGRLPTLLEGARASLATAGAALQGWHERLVGFQERAREYERQAAQIRRALRAAEARHEQAKRDPDLDLAGRWFSDPVELRAAQARLDAAERRLAEAAREVRRQDDELRDIIRRTQSLLDEHDDEARATADRIRAAARDHAPPSEHWWDEAAKLLSDAGHWIEEHAGKIGDVMSALSAVAAVAALFWPPAGIIAAALAAGAFAFHAWDAGRHGKLDVKLQAKWPPVVMDAETMLTLGSDALGIIPGVGVASAGIKALRGIEAAGGARAVWRAVAEASGGPSALGKDFVKASDWAIRQLRLDWDAVKVGKGLQTAVDGTLAAGSVASAVDRDNAFSNNPVVKYGSLARGAHGAVFGGHVGGPVHEGLHNAKNALSEGAHDLSRHARELARDMAGRFRGGDPVARDLQEWSRDAERGVKEMAHDQLAAFKELGHDTNRKVEELKWDLRILAGRMR